ncbi:PQQ-dependent sugar dehydrogenase [Pseudoxanthobacter sp. M-2]|uniref:PQQ-dependent sugar dehydrogenase n=1 Tax=Pseudoxanthobacter sp. M-2 TaxID=3078754 RepID=UPI0038FC4B49
MTAARLALSASLAALLTAPALAEVVETEHHSMTVERLAGPLEHPWSVAVLPDGAMLVTERPGRLRLIVDGELQSEPVSGVPDVRAGGQGGLLDVVLDPDFAGNRMIYLAFSEAGEGGAGTAVARGRLTRDGATARLDDVEVIFQQVPKVSGTSHFGARLVFAPDGKLFIGLGDRQQRERAQDLSTTIGKLVRINADGSIPDDNPFVGQEGALPEIWSYGHRNIQAAALDPSTSDVVAIEHGARGGDEINYPEVGKNYGWPVITHGVDYSGEPIGVGKAAEGMEQPIYQWTPSIAPSGMAYYTGTAFPEWNGDLFVGALRGQMLVRLDIEGDRVVGEERLLEGTIGRIRDVRQAPDGSLLVLTDAGDGALWRLTPAVTD